MEVETALSFFLTIFSTFKLVSLVTKADYCATASNVEKSLLTQLLRLSKKLARNKRQRKFVYSS